MVMSAAMMAIRSGGVIMTLPSVAAKSAALHPVGAIAEIANGDYPLPARESDHILHGDFGP
jgi:hypothetical protein